MSVSCPKMRSVDPVVVPLKPSQVRARWAELGSAPKPNTLDGCNAKRAADLRAK